MQALDRLGWAAGLALESYGVRVGVRLSRPSALGDVLERLPPLWKASRSPVVSRLYSFVVGEPPQRAGPRRFNLLYVDGLRAARSLEWGPVLETFENELKLYVAERSTRYVFVHAGVVGYRGRAIVLPGRSRSGKTRLVQALVAAGCTYYSDEFALLDARGRVHPYAAPLGLRSDDGPGESWSPPATERPALEAALVVAARYRPGRRWRIGALTAGQGLLALLENTVPARQRPQAVLTALRNLLRGAAAFRSLRGEGGESARQVLALFDQSQTKPNCPTPHWPAS